MYLPCPQILPEKINGFIHVDDNSDSLKIFFFPLAQIPENNIQILSNFLFTHRIPDCIFTLLDQDKSIVIDIRVYNKCRISNSKKQITFFSDNEETKEAKTIEFNGVFNFMTFLNQISIFNYLDYLSDDVFTIYKVHNAYDPYTINNLNLTLNDIDDLNAHQNLLQYLDFSTNSSSILIPFDSKILIKLTESPDDEQTLTLLSKSLIPPCYAPLLIIILLLDSPLLEDETNSLLHKSYSNLSIDYDYKRKCAKKRFSSSSFALKRFNGVVPDPPPLQIAPKKLFILDEMSIGGSWDICTDYQALKKQWTTITKGQIRHMPNLRISMKLLEREILKNYQEGHPLITVIFNAMSSQFLMRDKFETYKAEFFFVLSGVAQLFHPLQKIVEFDAEDIEHFVFWLFNALIAKTGIVEIVEQSDPEQLLSTSFHTVMIFHPLMYQLIEPCELSSFKFLAETVYSLYANVLKGHKLWLVWVTALVSDDPMNFFQMMLAVALMMIYPNLVGSKNVVESVENNLVSLLRKTSPNDLIANTLKLISESKRNGDS